MKRRYRCVFNEFNRENSGSGQKYIPGFIINRLSSAIAREAGYMIGQEWVTPEDIDKAVCTTFGPRFPFEGPLELFDYVGWDVAVAVSKFMFPHLCSNTDPMPWGSNSVLKAV